LFILLRYSLPTAAISFSVPEEPFCKNQDNSQKESVKIIRTQIENCNASPEGARQMQAGNRKTGGEIEYTVPEYEKRE
jgi:hypothetical protein